MSKKESKDRRANGDGSFYLRPDGTYQFRATIGRDDEGKLIRKAFYGKTQAECRRKLKEFQKKQNAPVTVSPDITLKSWSEKYLESCRKGTMKETSYHQLDLLQKKIPNSLTKKKVSEIRPIELQEFLNKFAETASKSYIGKMFSLLRAIFTEAQENDLCLKNPARKLRAPQKRQKPRESFTRGEVETIVAFALTYRKNSKSDRLNRAFVLISTAIIVLLSTGIRRGELLGLMWSDIEDTVIHVRRAAYLKDGVPTADNGIAKTYSSIRDIPIGKELSDLIRAVPKRGLYVFAAYSGQIMNPRNFERSYDTFFKALQKAYPEVRRLSVHCCRHTFATLSQRNGANIRAVQLILGHTSIKTTAIYSHPDMEELQAASESFRNYVQPKK